MLKKKKSPFLAQEKSGREAGALQAALLILSNETLLPACLHVCTDK